MEAVAQGRKMGEESRCLRMAAIEESGTMNMMVLNATAVDLWLGLVWGGVKWTCGDEIGRAGV